MEKPDFLDKSRSLFERNRPPTELEVMMELKSMWEQGYRYAVCNDWWRVQEGFHTPEKDLRAPLNHGTHCACSNCCGDHK